MSSSPVTFAFGSRHFSDAGLVARVLGASCPVGSVVWSGCASGADRLSLAWAASAGLASRVFRADWGRFGSAAGPIRNSALVSALPAGSRAVCFLCGSFPGAPAIVAAGGLVAWCRAAGSPGSAHSLSLLAARGVPVLVVFACGTQVTPFVPKKVRTMRDDPNGSRKMPFGKHKGTMLMNVPKNYLVFLLGWENLSPNWKNIISQHLAVRSGADAPAPTGWRRQQGVIMTDEEDLGDDWRDVAKQRQYEATQDPHPYGEDEDLFRDCTDPDYEVGFMIDDVKPDAFGFDAERGRDLLETKRFRRQVGEYSICGECGSPKYGDVCVCQECPN